MKRPLIALSLVLFFTLFVVVVVRGREPLSTDTPLQVSLVDPTATSTPTATATTDHTNRFANTPATPTVTPAGLPPRLVQFQPINDPH
ncbi:MAG: hypothetical protein IPL78_34635 [Chloroflexi bacterium]|nr:hypothetical protein [Chloroflexota bacterium]